MNERIRELMEQAGITTNLDTDFFAKDPNKWVDYFADKFAELILKECIDAIDAARPYHTNDHLVNDYMNGVEHGHRFAITMIRKHFGVEE